MYKYFVAYQTEEGIIKKCGINGFETKETAMEFARNLLSKDKKAEFAVIEGKVIMSESGEVKL